MKRPKPPRENPTINRDNPARREAFLESLDRCGVSRIVPDGEEHTLVADVEVRVTRGNPKTFSRFVTFISGIPEILP